MVVYHRIDHLANVLGTLAAFPWRRFKMAAPGIRFDDGSGGFVSNCFPVRGLLRNAEEGKINEDS